MNGQVGRRRPIGVIVIAVVNFIGVFLVLAFALFMHPFLLAGGESVLPTPWERAGIWAFFSTIYVFCGLLVAVTIGLLGLRNWARILYLVLVNLVVSGGFLVLVLAAEIGRAHV